MMRIGVCAAQRRTRWSSIGVRVVGSMGEVPLRFRFAVGFSLILASCAVWWLPSALHWWKREHVTHAWQVPVPAGQASFELFGQSVVCTCGEGHMMRKGWHRETGFLGEEASTWNVEHRQTWYTPDGRVAGQSRRDPLGGVEWKLNAPWWWGAIDQAAPTAPWFRDPLGFEEWAVLGE